MTIQTKFLPATNTRGSRIKATLSRTSEWTKTTTVSFDHALSAEENHRAAMQALCRKLCFNAELYAGDYFAGDMYWVDRRL